MKQMANWRLLGGFALAVLLFTGSAQGQRQRVELSYPPELPDGQTLVTDRSVEMLRPTTDTIRDGVRIAEVPPEIELVYFPHQDYLGNPWSNWGDSLYANGKFYGSIGDHLRPRGTAMVFEYDPEAKQIRLLADVAHFLETGDPNPPSQVRKIEKDDPVQRGPNSLLSEGENYTPGKIHGRLDMGSDGWIYYSTHRGSSRTTNDEHGFRGDWILRTHPETAQTEMVAAYPIEKHCLPASVLDPERMIFYAGTKEGADAEKQGVYFLAYDVKNGEVLKTAPNGFGRYAILDPETGRVFWDGSVRGEETIPLVYDPETNEITEAEGVPHVRSATRATEDGWVYGTSERTADLWGFNVRTGETKDLGNGQVGSQRYVTSMEIDPTGRYLYYIPGAHGGAASDGSPVVQFDIETQTPKVLAFLHPHLYENYGFIPEGTFGIALDDAGERIFIVWNGKRHPDVRAWESCAAMVLHIPESERQP